jgi:hypothetical protein
MRGSARRDVAARNSGMLGEQAPARPTQLKSLSAMADRSG